MDWRMVGSCAHDHKMRVFNITNGAELFNGDMGEDIARCMCWSPTNSHLIAYCTQGGKVPVRARIRINARVTSKWHHGSPLI